MFYSDIESLGRIVIVGTLAYIGLVIMLRVSGKRTLSKFNAFDLIVTVAFGSILSTILLNNDVELAEGLTALALLIVLQFIVTWLSVRCQTWRQIIKSEPTLLYYKGEYLHQDMKRQRVTKSEILAALRENNMAIDKVNAVVMETDGQFSVLEDLQNDAYDDEEGIFQTLSNLPQKN